MKQPITSTIRRYWTASTALPLASRVHLSAYTVKRSGMNTFDGWPLGPPRPAS